MRQRLPHCCSSKGPISETISGYVIRQLAKEFLRADAMLRHHTGTLEVVPDADEEHGRRKYMLTGRPVTSSRRTISLFSETVRWELRQQPSVTSMQSTNMAVSLQDQSRASGTGVGHGPTTAEALHRPVTAGQITRRAEPRRKKESVRVASTMARAGRRASISQSQTTLVIWACFLKFIRKDR